MNVSLINWLWKENETPLHLAAMNGRIDVAEILLTRGCNKDPKNKVFRYVAYFTRALFKFLAFVHDTLRAWLC